MADFPTSRFQRAGVSAAAITDLQAAWALLSPAVQDAELTWISTLSDAEVAAITSFPASGGAVPTVQPPDGSVIEVVEPGSGSLSVTDGTHTVAATEIDFTSGATVTDGGGGKAEVAVSGGSKASVVSVPYASTITPALSTSQVTIFDVGTITGPLTVDAPTGTPFDGQLAWFRFQQDATGHAVTFQTGSSGQYHFRSLVTQSSIPTTANTPFDVLFGYSAETAFFEALAINY